MSTFDDAHAWDGYDDYDLDDDDDPWTARTAAARAPARMAPTRSVTARTSSTGVMPAAGRAGAATRRSGDSLVKGNAAKVYELVLTDSEGELRITLSGDELSATIEAFNVAHEQLRRRDSVNRPRPPFDRAGTSAHRKFVQLEGGRSWMDGARGRMSDRYKPEER